MKRFCMLWLLLLLCGCAAVTTEETAVMPDPLWIYCGDWTAETGDGSVVWSLRADGTAVVPRQAVDDYRRIGGVGDWGLTDEGLTVKLDRDLALIPLTEDGYTKLHCPLLNQTLVRVEEREAAYGRKFVDVTLTDENFWDYFVLRQVSEPVDAYGQRLWKEVFVMTSSVYEDGLVYLSERDVEVDFVYWTTYELQADRAPYGVTFYVDDFNAVTAKGTLTFVKSDYIAEYHCDGSSRKVVLTDGTTMETTFDTFRYDGYPY